jgi:hypothetical protein
MRTEAQTDRPDNANSRFSQFCERAFKKSSRAVPMKAVQSRSVPNRLVAFMQQADRSAESMCLALLPPHWLGYGPPASERRCDCSIALSALLKPAYTKVNIQNVP